MSGFVMRNLAELEPVASRQATEIFVDSFLASLHFISRDREKLVRALEHALVKKRFFVAVEDGRVQGIFAFSPCLSGSRKDDFGSRSGSTPDLYEKIRGPIPCPLNLEITLCKNVHSYYPKG